MSIKKQYLKSKPLCKVTFSIDAELINGGKEVAVLGEFNDWNPKDGTMRKLKDCSFTKTIELAPGQDYQFRYLIDRTRWINDSQVDKTLEQNGVIAL